MSDESIPAPRGWRGHLPGLAAPRAVRGFAYLFILTLLLAGANLLWTSRQVGALNAKTSALCRFDADLGGAPVGIDPRTGKASLLGVSIVSDARVAWHQTGCAGRLPSPDPSFMRWAAYYRLRVN